MLKRWCFLVNTTSPCIPCRTLGLHRSHQSMSTCTCLAACLKPSPGHAARRLWTLPQWLPCPNRGKDEMAECCCCLGGYEDLQHSTIIHQFLVDRWLLPCRWRMALAFSHARPGPGEPVGLSGRGLSTSSAMAMVGMAFGKTWWRPADWVHLQFSAEHLQGARGESNRVGVESLILGTTWKLGLLPQFRRIMMSTISTEGPLSHFHFQWLDLLFSFSPGGAPVAAGTGPGLRPPWTARRLCARLHHQSMRSTMATVPATRADFACFLGELERVLVHHAPFLD